MLAYMVVEDNATCMDGAASLTPGTSWLPQGVPVPGCALQAVLVLHLVQLGLRGLQSPANIVSQLESLLAASCRLCGCCTSTIWG